MFFQGIIRMCPCFLSLLRLTSAVPNDIFKDSLKCCLRNGVNQYCAENLCHPPQNWHEFDYKTAYNLSIPCNKFLTRIGRCLSGGRNNSACCKDEPHHSQHDELCFHLCTGDAFSVDLRKSKAIELNYDLCLVHNFKLPVLTCVARGFETIPTPPVNLKVLNVGSDHALVGWDQPTKLAKLVSAYVVHYQVDHLKNSPRATSPQTVGKQYDLKKLLPNTRYKFNVVAETSSSKYKSQYSFPGRFKTKSV